MLRILKAFVFASVLGLLSTCAHQPPRGTPGTRCNAIASCCLGWVWVGVCMPAHPPFCGCSCEQAPNPYGSEKECLADHPETPRRADALAP
jgi:hypothetical protein